MPINSYAQNFEDVMLFRALGHVKKGFYIDIGAGEPEIDSVTKLFYDLGWTGINVEPNRLSFKKLAFSRPNDVNLNCAITYKSMDLNFWQMKNTGLSTLNETQFKEHLSKGFEGEKIQVRGETLSSICDEYVGLTDIHFLKIDVEGWEREVLEGANFQDYRPWIVVIEATIPNTQIDNSKEWQDLLLNSNYKIVYRDGLNIFFLAKEKQELENKFEFPPNVFDDFVKYDHSLISELSATHQELSATHQELSATRQELSAFEIDLILIKKSNIWRKTRFLRTLKSFLINKIISVK
jgi:FkbM family methyltransferase